MSSGKVRVDVECDACRKVDALYGFTVDEAQQLVDAAGWFRNIARDQDLCPDCSVERVGSRVPSMLL